MSAKFNRLETITHDCFEVWDLSGICYRGVASETMKFVGQVYDEDVIRSRNEDSKIDITAPHTKVLFEEVEKVLAQRNLKRVEDQYWGQIHRLYESTQMHDHNPQDVAWVYYARVPKNSGVLVFTQYLGWTKIHEHTYQPKVGQLVIFPGWMVHRVTKNFNEWPRVSISGNASYIKDSE